MRYYQVWMEGYAATGQRATASCSGTFEASSFKEACDQAFSDPKHKPYYDSETLTYWGCRLFDNEVDARRSFG